MFSTTRFSDALNSQPEDGQYVDERHWPRVDFIFGYSSDLPHEIGDNQVFLEKDTGNLYIQGIRNLKKINSIGGEQPSNPGNSDNKPIKIADSVVVVADKTALDKEEPRKNTLYVIEDAGEIRYYDGEAYRVLYNGDVKTVTGFHVNADVPKDAKFTDTTYKLVTDEEDGLMPASDHLKLKNMASKDDLKKGLNDIPSRDDFKTALASKANSEDVYAKSETDQKLAEALKSVSWKNPVDSYNALYAAYPDAEVDDICAVKNGNVYRYDGQTWTVLYEKVEIPAAATQTKDGLFSKEDKAALDNVPNTYASKDELQQAVQKIPDSSLFAGKQEVKDEIAAAVGPLATQVSLEELKSEVDNRQIPDAYSKIDSDKRYAQLTDLPDLTNYAKSSDLDAYLTKNESLDFVSSKTLENYVLGQDVPTMLSPYIKSSDAASTYAPLPPDGKAYVLDDALSSYAKQADYLTLLQRVAALERAVEKLQPQSDIKVMVMGYAKIDSNGEPTGDYYGIQEFTSKTNFIYETKLAGTSIQDDTLVRLFANTPEIKYNMSHIKATEEVDLPSINTVTKLDGPFYFLSEPFHIYRNDSKVYSGISVI